MTTYLHTWDTPGSVVPLLTTELNALDSGSSVLSGEIDNSSGLKKYINLELVLAEQASARTGSAVSVYLCASLDGTTFCDDTTPAPEFLCQFGLDLAVTARRVVRVNRLIPPGEFKLKITNSTGQAFAATGNVVNYSLHGEKSVEST